MKAFSLTALVALALAMHSSQALAAMDVCPAFDAETQSAAAQVKKTYKENIVVDKIPGAAYAAFNKDCLLFADVVGSGNSAGTQPLSPMLSLFRLASVSKLFAALSIMQLVEKGAFTLDTPLLELDRAAFVRKLKREEKPERLAKWGKIRIRHLLSHQAGISKDVPGTLVFFNTEAIRDHAYPGMEEFLAGLKDVEFLYEPGEIAPGIKYSNLAVNMLARIVAAYNPLQLSFPAYVRANILLPLGMTNTFYDIPLVLRHRLTWGYGAPNAEGTRIEIPKVYEVGSYDGSIGVASNAVDLARLGQALLKMLAFERNPLLNNKELIRTWFTPVSRFVPSLNWAHGPLWQTLPGEPLTNPLWTGHTGTGYGERAVLLVAPEKNLGVVVLLNTFDANREKYAQYISKALSTTNDSMSDETRALVNSARASMSATVPMPPETPTTVVPREQLEKFAGKYFADAVGPQQITITNDNFLFFYGSKLIVENLEKGEFRFPRTGGPLFNSEPIRFRIDPATGKVIEARVAQVKLFQKLD